MLIFWKTSFKNIFFSLGKNPNPTKLKTPRSVACSEELEIETNFANLDF